jgi:hypothetical protein
MLFFVRDESVMNDPPRELDHRTTDRIDVWLLWRERDDRVVVTVFDQNTGGASRFRFVMASERSTSSITRTPTRTGVASRRAPNPAT